MFSGRRSSLDQSCGQALLCGSAGRKFRVSVVLMVMTISRWLVTDPLEVKSAGFQIRSQWLTRRTLTEANYGFWVEDGWAIVVKLQVLRRRTAVVWANRAELKTERNRSKIITGLWIRVSSLGGRQRSGPGC